MKIKGVIFDMDGTITDSERHARKLALEVFANEGYQVSEEFHNRFIGANRASAIKILSEKTKDDKISASILNLFSDRLSESISNNKIELKKGALEIINFLDSHNIPTVLATSANIEKVKQSFKSNDMEVPFRNIITGDMVKNGKPDPEIFLKAARMINVDIKNCLIVEDSYNGIEAALASGAVTIMVPDLLKPVEKHIRLGAIIKNDLFEVLDFIRQYANL
ncbi:MAG: HAD family hydrolase [Erysipelotrichaceae bacterium]|jgi:beta-phosphoglucomutase